MCNLSVLYKEASKGNKDSMVKIIKKFNPLIKKYSNKLIYDGADTDLIICLIETIQDNHVDFNADKYVVGYISSTIYHKYINLSKKNMSIVNNETELNDYVISNYKLDQYEDIVNNYIFISNLLDKLPHNQKQIIKKIFFNDLAVVELAKQLNISRQSVNRTKNRALKNLRKLAIE
jgi:RNA polymerase sigma factor (sigma-70 family)